MASHFRLFGVVLARFFFPNFRLWIPKRCKGVHCVDLGESFPTSIYLQNLASIQPRTSPTKTIPDTPIPTPPPPLKPALLSIGKRPASVSVSAGRGPPFVEGPVIPLVEGPGQAPAAATSGAASIHWCPSSSFLTASSNLVEDK